MIIMTIRQDDLLGRYHIKHGGQIAIISWRRIWLLQRSIGTIFHFLRERPIVNRLRFTTRCIVINSGSLFLRLACVLRTAFKFFSIANGCGVLFRWNRGHRMLIRWSRFSINLVHRPLRSNCFNFGIYLLSKATSFSSLVGQLIGISHVVLQPIQDVEMNKIKGPILGSRKLASSTSFRPCFRVEGRTNFNVRFPFVDRSFFRTIALRLRTTFSTQFRRLFSQRRWEILLYLYKGDPGRAA